MKLNSGYPLIELDKILPPTHMEHSVAPRLVARPPTTMSSKPLLDQRTSHASRAKNPPRRVLCVCNGTSNEDAHHVLT